MSNCIKGKAPKSRPEEGFILYVIEMHDGHLCLRMTGNQPAPDTQVVGSFSRHHLRFSTLLDANVGPPDGSQGQDTNNPSFVRAVFKHIGLVEPTNYAVFRAVRDAQERA